jgi:hypothetical protein
MQDMNYVQRDMNYVQRDMNYIHVFCAEYNLCIMHNLKALITYRFCKIIYAE